MKRKTEYSNIEQLLYFDYKKIKIPQINCFNSNIFSDFCHWHCSVKTEIEKEIKNLIIEEKESKIIQLDLTRIDSIGSSKSKSRGEIFDTIYDFGKHLVLENKYNWTLDECKKHIEEKLHNGTYELNYYKWDDRYEWNNIDGSHHFAVANFIITNQKLDYKINCLVKEYSLNEVVLKDLLNKYYIFISEKDFYYLIFEKFSQDEIKKCKINNDDYMFFINKNTHQRYLIKLLKIIDNRYVFNFNEFLKDYYEKLYTRIKKVST